MARNMSLKLFRTHGSPMPGTRPDDEVLRCERHLKIGATSLQ